jgi:GTP cyclohydrolase I
MRLNSDMDAELLFKRIWGERYNFAEGHMANTPKRFVKMLTEMTTPEDFEFTVFDSDANDMIICDNIDFHSLCAHHIVPYIGKAHIAYIPNGRIVGLSKIPRTVKFHAADLTVQEELTRNIAVDLQSRLDPVGVAVVLEAEHLCAALRGVRSPGMRTTTSCMMGAFADHSRQARSEFLSLIAH